MARRSTRRSFLRQGSLAAAAAVTAPLVLSARARGANDRIAVGCIGVRNQGAANISRFLGAGADVVAVCDVDAGVARAAADLVARSAPPCRVSGDYRELLDQKGLDAVVVTTPDHWHALISIHACEALKDVYCEKPLSLTIAEGRRMVTAARQHDRIVQTGSQQRSDREFWTACMLARNGLIGTVQEVLVGIPEPNHPVSIGGEEPIPLELNYDLWLGPAPLKPYHSRRVHYNFRFWWDYSGGQITNFGAHHLDIAQWALGTDAGGPAAVAGAAEFHPERVHEVTEACRITYTYADGTRLILGQRQADIPEGVTLIGSKGRIFVNRGQLKTEPSELSETDLAATGLTQLYRSHDHTRNFLDCMRTRELPVCDVEIGHRSATLCHLGNIVARLGRGIAWDPATETMIGDDAAQSMVDRDYRSPWTHQMKLSRNG